MNAVAIETNDAVMNEVAAEFSKLASEIASIRARKNQLAKDEKELVDKLYSLGILDKNSTTAESFKDDTVVVNKIPTLKEYSVDKVRVLADGLKISRKVLVKRKVVSFVDADALVAMSKQGLFPEELLAELAVTYNKLNIKRL